MTVVRNVWADLVDKRLWPVAAALVVALVAIPVVLMKAAPGAKAPTPVASAGSAPLLANPASIASSGSGGPVGGAFKDPFRQQHVPRAPATALVASAAGPGTATSSSSSSAPSSGSSTGSGGSGGSGSSGGSSGRSHSTPAPVTKLRLKFGPSDGRRPTREVAPGTPLPTGSNPLIVLLDVSKSGTASFLVSSDAQPQGDGRCEPNRTICATLFLKKGGTEFFDVSGPSGTVQYQLDVLGVVNG